MVALLEHGRDVLYRADFLHRGIGALPGICYVINKCTQMLLVLFKQCVNFLYAHSLSPNITCKGVCMNRSWLIALVLLVGIGCAPKKTLELQTFSPIVISLPALERQQFSELVDVVNAAYDPDRKEYHEAKLYKEEGQFLYYRVYSVRSTACYRVTIDKRRSRIINMQPDCAIEE